MALDTLVTVTGVKLLTVSSISNAKYNQTGNSNYSNNDWTSICWNPDLEIFAAVSSSGTNNRILLSSNDSILSRETVIKNLLPMIDIVVGAVLTPGGKPPTVITREMLSLMEPKSILSDVSVDQGGCFETSKPTTHGDPTYEVDNIIHYCVKNIPSAVPFTATNALNEATKPFILKFANSGLHGLFNDDKLLMALNTYKGKLTNQEVAEAHSLSFTSPDSV